MSVWGLDTYNWYWIRTRVGIGMCTVHLISGHQHFSTSWTCSVIITSTDCPVKKKIFLHFFPFRNLRPAEHKYTRVGLKRFCIKYLPSRSISLDLSVSYIVHRALCPAVNPVTRVELHRRVTRSDPFHSYSCWTRSITVYAVSQRKARFCGYAFSKSHDT